MLDNHAGKEEGNLHPNRDSALGQYCLCGTSGTPSNTSCFSVTAQYGNTWSLPVPSIWSSSACSWERRHIEVNFGENTCVSMNPITASIQIGIATHHNAMHYCLPKLPMFVCPPTATGAQDSTALSTCAFFILIFIDTWQWQRGCIFLPRCWWWQLAFLICYCYPTMTMTMRRQGCPRTLPSPMRNFMSLTLFVSTCCLFSKHLTTGVCVFSTISKCHIFLPTRKIGYWFLLSGAEHTPSLVHIAGVQLQSTWWPTSLLLQTLPDPWLKR